MLLGGENWAGFWKLRVIEGGTRRQFSRNKLYSVIVQIDLGERFDKNKTAHRT
jgi:hypothetical protein